MRLLRISVLGFLMGLPQENHRTAEFANGAEVLQLSTCPSLCCTEEAATGKRRAAAWGRPSWVLSRYRPLTAPSSGVSTGQRVSPGLVTPK